jgi:hypothetical protein
VVENKVARAAAMVGNAAEELRAGLGKTRGSVARGRGGAPPIADGRLEAVP